MARSAQLRELLVGIERLALLRRLYEGSDHAASERLAEVRWLLDDEAFSTAELTSEAGPCAGYRSWSESYDEPGNPLVALEQPAVRALLEPLPPGRALDAACGTGRYARHLVERGHEVVGFDLTPEMLLRAAAKVPEGTFLEGRPARHPGPRRELCRRRLRQPGFIREHTHTHAHYLAALRSVDLDVVGCLEPALGEGHLRA